MRFSRPGQKGSSLSSAHWEIVFHLASYRRANTSQVFHSSAFIRFLDFHCWLITHALQEQRLEIEVLKTFQHSFSHLSNYFTLSKFKLSLPVSSKKLSSILKNYLQVAQWPVRVVFHGKRLFKTTRVYILTGSCSSFL